MNFQSLIVIFCAFILVVHAFPIGKEDGSEETEVEAETDTAENTEIEETTSQKENTNEKVNDVEESPSSRKKRGMYSSEKSEEDILIGHGVHHRLKRHAEHPTHFEHTPHQVKRNSDHRRIKRSEGHPHKKRSSLVPVIAKDDHNKKRNVDDRHEHREHLEHQLETHANHIKNTPETAGHVDHHLVKLTGGEGGHRHQRSTDQGHDEDEPDDEIRTDETDETTDEPADRKRRNTDDPLPSFPSDYEASEHSNSPFE